MAARRAEERTQRRPLVVSGSSAEVGIALLSEHKWFCVPWFSLLSTQAEHPYGYRR